MNYVLSLQESTVTQNSGGGRSCNVASLVSCWVCSVSLASIVLCLG
ncbi:MAG TPA: hypothetical protein VNJ54_04340 [Plantibacter sp.]|nr:hypothetical protein [Plantibacter sp.]